MSKESYLQIIKTKDQRTQKAVAEYVALGELDRIVKTSEERNIWESWWQEFVTGDQWLPAIMFIKTHGI